MIKVIIMILHIFKFFFVQCKFCFIFRKLLFDRFFCHNATSGNIYGYSFLLKKRGVLEGDLFALSINSFLFCYLLLY